jgi:hypothetical protein
VLHVSTLLGHPWAIRLLKGASIALHHFLSDGLLSIRYIFAPCFASSICCWMSHSFYCVCVWCWFALRTVETKTWVTSNATECGNIILCNRAVWQCITSVVVPPLCCCGQVIYAKHWDATNRNVPLCWWHCCTTYNCLTRCRIILTFTALLAPSDLFLVFTPATFRKSSLNG